MVRNICLFNDLCNHLNEYSVSVPKGVRCSGENLLECNETLYSVLAWLDDGDLIYSKFYDHKIHQNNDKVFTRVVY